MKGPVFLLFAAVAACSGQIRVGMIGTDTSHATAFTRTLNDPSNKDHVPGAKVVAAYKGGSPDLESSFKRVEGFAQELKDKWGVEFVEKITDLCPKVDAILLESVDGRVHLKQAREAFQCKKPVFIDKPLAATVEDARAIAKLGKETGVPWFSTSSLRYGEIARTMKVADATGAITWGPGPFDKTHYLDLSWYAIHPVELLFTLLGPGVEEVTRVEGKDADEIIGRWKDGRIGTVRALRPYGDYGALVFRPKSVLRSPEKAASSYAPMLKEIVRFFETKQPPVPNEETLEIFAFMDAAQKSKEQGGKPVKVR